MIVWTIHPEIEVMLVDDHLSFSKQLNMAALIKNWFVVFFQVLKKIKKSKKEGTLQRYRARVFDFLIPSSVASHCFRALPHRTRNNKYIHSKRPRSHHAAPSISVVRARSAAAELARSLALCVESTSRSRSRSTSYCEWKRTELRTQ